MSDPRRHRLLALQAYLAAGATQAGPGWRWNLLIGAGQ
jgi:hypothetical protein